MLENIKASLKFLLLVSWLLACYVPLWVAKKLNKLEARNRVVRIINCGILRIMGVRLLVTGQPVADRPLLLVTNHISYLDIPVLASHADIRFTPKSEIGQWPFVGSVCRLCDSVFVDRRVEKMGEVKAAMRDTLARGEIICLFPEATTGNGLHVLPFKPGFFSMAEDMGEGELPLTVQPAAITYTHIRRLPIDSTQWPQVAWYGDMELAPHLWELLKLGAINAELVYLPPVTINQLDNRKKLAAHCQQAISDAVETIRHRQREVSVKKAHFQPRFLRMKG